MNERYFQGFRLEWLDALLWGVTLLPSEEVNRIQETCYSSSSFQILCSSQIRQSLQFSCWHRHSFTLMLMCFFFLFLFLRFFFFFLIFFICSEFCHTLKWNSHEFTCVPHPNPHSHLPLHPLPLGLPSASGPSACLMHPTWAGDLFHPR